MSSMVSLATLYFFIIALPIASIANSAPTAPIANPAPTVIHRIGNIKNPVSGSIRPADWHMTGDTVHAHDSKGLSLKTTHPGTSKNENKKIWSINTQNLVDHPDFEVIHDGGKEKPNGGKHGDNHATLAYKGPDIHKADLKKKIRNLPWNPRSLGEDANDRKFPERVYGRAQLERAYQRALEDLEELD